MNVANLATGQSLKTKYNGQIVAAQFVKTYRESLVLRFDGREFLRTKSSVEKFNQFDRSAGQTSLVEVPPIEVPTVNIPTVVPVSGAVPYFNVNQRFDFIERMVDMVIRNHASSFIVTGSGGLGKTHTVLNRFKENDLGDADFIKVSGHVTPKAMYRALYEAGDKIVLFDDCDSVFNNETTLNLLKAAFDSLGNRHVCWCSEVEHSDLPRSFDFEGRAIFISNYRLAQIPQPIRSRAMYVDVTMSSDEKLERIRAIAPQLFPELSERARQEVIELITTLKDSIAELSFRTFTNACKICRANPTCWRPMATYMITAAPRSER